MLNKEATPPTRPPPRRAAARGESASRRCSSTRSCCSGESSRLSLRRTCHSLPLAASTPRTSCGGMRSTSPRPNALATCSLPRPKQGRSRAPRSSCCPDSTSSPSRYASLSASPFTHSPARTASAPRGNSFDEGVLCGECCGIHHANRVELSRAGDNGAPVGGVLTSRDGRVMWGQGTYSPLQGYTPATPRLPAFYA